MYSPTCQPNCPPPCTSTHSTIFLLNVFISSSGLTVLHTSKPLQKLLGVTEVAHGHLLKLVRQLHSQGSGKGGMLAKMGTPWLAQLLLCVFDSLAQVRRDGTQVGLLC